MKNNMKKLFLGIFMAAVVMVTAAGVSAEAAFELCTHYWTVEEFAESVILNEYTHPSNNGGECEVKEHKDTYYIRCRSCGKIVGTRTETNTDHSICLYK